MGNSTNKKDAQSNAARDFVNYLVRINEVKSEEVPAVGVSIHDQELDIFVCFQLSSLGFKLTDRFTGCVHKYVVCRGII